MRVVVLAAGVSVSALVLGVVIGSYVASGPSTNTAAAPVTASLATPPGTPTGAPPRVSPSPGASPEVTGSFASRMAAAEMLPAAAPSAAPPPTRLTAGNCPGNPNALGISRVVEIDTTGGPGFGLEQFKSYDFLKEGEVVLTFDDGPWPGNTPAVLAALASHCVKATFFPIGKHTMWHPEILKQVALKGHTIGSHTWSHADLSKKSADERRDEIEKGFSAVNAAIGGTAAPFFRFPGLRNPPEAVTYLGERNIGIFSIDVDSFDFKIKKPEVELQSIMTKLKKHGKGIILMHDFQRVTAIALPELLNQLKAGGYKVVHLTASTQVKTLPEYDALVVKEMKGATADARPVSSVVRTTAGAD
jgi:peptidoglycan/xylan/chitin deacetylase (PgdA/CDA1 family)